MEWISVEDKLPKETVISYPFYHKVRYVPSDGCWHYAESGGIYIHGVTHWMPLPEPPEQ